MYRDIQPAGDKAAHQRSSLPEALSHHARIRPDSSAFTFLSIQGPDVTLSYAQLHHLVAHRATQLRTKFHTQSRLMLALHSNSEFVVEFLATVCAGHIAVPVYPSDRKSGMQGVSRITRIAQDCQPTAVITRDATLAGLADHGVELLAPGPVDTSPLPSQASLAPDHRPDLIALLQYTSGSTGDPKGVMVARAALEANSAMLSQALQLTPDACGVGWLPLYHDMGLIGHVVHPVYVGMHSVLMETAAFLARPLTWLEVIAKYQAVISSAPDFAYRLCAQISDARVERADLDLSHWRLALNGSEPVRRQTLQDFSAKFLSKGFRATSLFPCYGLAESTLFVTGSAWDPAAASPEDDADRVPCGVPPTNVHIAVVDPETLRAVAAGKAGEVCVSSLSNGKGYWNRPSLSTSVFAVELPDHAGRRYLRTGDIGRVVGSQLEIVGRLKNVIIVRGRNVHAEDLEELLCQTVNGLRSGRVGAISVQHGGVEHLVIVAEVAPGAALDTLEQEVRRCVFEHAEVQPLWVAFVSPRGLPRTSSGKLRRQHCADLLISGLLPLLRDYRTRSSLLIEAPTSWLEEVCASACAQALQADGVSVMSDFFADLGMDSMSAVVLADILSDHTGTKVSTGDIYKFPTIRSLALRVQELIERPQDAASSAWDPEAGLDFLAESDPGSVLHDAIASVPHVYEQQARSHQLGFHEGGTILVTGATGFLGPHLIDQLLRQTTAKIVCIVRAASDAQAAHRLHDDMTFYGLSATSWGPRLECLAGDISQRSLGLPDERYDQLADQVDVVFNNAAEVNFLMPYSRLKGSNVHGVRNLLQFCLRGRSKHFCHTSTQGIYEAHGPDTLYAEDAQLSDEVVRVAKGYARTKLVAEHLIGRIRSQGVAATVLRVGMVSGDAQRGIAKGDPLISSLLLGCAQCGAMPEDDATFDMSPVDTVARAMVALARRPEAMNGTFHVSRRGGVSTREIADMLRAANVPLEVLPFSEWKARVLQQGAANALHHYRWIVRELTYVPPRALFGTERAEALLAVADVPAPQIDASVVAKYLDFYRGQGRYPVPKD